MDSIPPSGQPPGSDVRFLTEQLLDRWKIDYAILGPLANFYWPATGKLGLALAHAVNEWNATEWLGQDRRLIGSVVVPFEDSAAASREIKRRAKNPRFVQILIPVRTREPLGHVKYWAMYEAAAEHNLPIAVHVAGFAGIATGAGWPATFFEWHVGWQHPFQAHIVSLISSGVFERLPNLRFVFQEAGVAWLASLMWRLDRAWRMMGVDAPSSLKHEPSYYVRRHFWLTTQPIDEPEKPEFFTQMLRHVGMDDNILFSSDYPHWDFDAPDQIFPRGVAQETRAKIMHLNATHLYGLQPPQQ